MPNGKPGDHPLTDILIHNRLRRSSEPVRCCSAKVDRAGFTIQRGIVCAELRESRMDPGRPGSGADQPV
jgi:hypothetical protein